MAVIAILFSLTIPAVRGLSGTASFSTGARQVASALTAARSHAIAKHTVVRFGIATAWQGESSAAFKKYALWEWDREEEGFVQFESWEGLPKGIIFEMERPKYVRDSAYARKDGSSIRGDFVPSPDGARFITGAGDEKVQIAWIEFTPSGGARVRGGEMRNILMTLAAGHLEGGKMIYTEHEDGEPTNWAQMNIDTLTGRVRIYRP